MAQIDYIPEQTIILALREHSGNLGLAATALGVSRGELATYMTNHPAVMEEKRQLQEAFKDNAEEMLIKRMANSDSLLMFYLKTQAKDRGYDTSVAVTGEGGGPVSVKMDAKALIAAMREGMYSIAEENDEISNLLGESDRLIDGGRG